MTLVNDLRLDTGDDTGVFASGAAASFHNLLSAIHPDTTPASATSNQLILSQGGSWIALSAPSNGQIVAMTGGAVQWIAQNLLSSTHSDTIQFSPSSDELIASSGNKWIGFSKGSPGQFLKTTASGKLDWETVLAIPPSGTGRVSSSAYLVVSVDEEYNVINQAGSIVVLPQNPLDWQSHTVKDNTGLAGSSPIVVYGSGNLIDGNSNAQIGSNYGALKFIYNGAQWNIV